MKKLWNQYKNKIIVFSIVAVLFVAVMSVVAVISGSIMRIFGFEYQSVSSIVLFFIIATIISFPMNLFASAAPKALLKTEVLPLHAAKILYLVFDTVATSLGLVIVDYCMENVSASYLAILIISFLLALFSIDEIK